METRRLVFDGANLPTRISHNDNWDASFNAPNVTVFAHGPTNDRYFRSERTGEPGSESDLRQVYYGADGFEYEVLNSNSFVYRVEPGPVVYTRASSSSTVKPPETAYQLRDRLGSTIAVADRWAISTAPNPTTTPWKGACAVPSMRSAVRAVSTSVMSAVRYRRSCRHCSSIRRAAAASPD